MVDVYSRKLFARFIKDLKKTTILKSMLEICSDNPLEYIKADNASPFHKTSNAFAERALRTIKESLSKSLIEHSRILKQEDLDSILHHYNNLCNSSTKGIPNERDLKIGTAHFDETYNRHVKVGKQILIKNIHPKKFGPRYNVTKITKSSNDKVNAEALTI
uniref:Integrase catalytic domain-containing protein n=1 Tax=Strongyloides venezuelensis TaxID=75913 RepID=A0A0K0FAW3_STRVS